MNLCDNTRRVYTRETYKSLKGYLVICILIHHLYQYTGFLATTRLGYPLYLLGHWAVVLFMFMSGFGVFSSYLSKGDSYIKNFPRKRLLSVYLSYLFFLLLYAIYSVCNGVKITSSAIIHSLTYGGTLVSFGWYIQLTLLLYVLFYVLKSLIHNDNLFLVVLGGAIITIIIAHMILSFEKTIYEPAASFFLGALFAYYENKKAIRLTKMCWACASIGLLSFLVFTLLSTFLVFRYSIAMYTNIPLDILHLVLMILADYSLIAFVCAFLVIADKKIPGFISNPVSKFLGTYSFEIYAVQGLIFSILIKKIDNRAIYAVVAISSIIIASILIHKLLSLLKGYLNSRVSPIDNDIISEPAGRITGFFRRLFSRADQTNHL